MKCIRLLIIVLVALLSVWTPARSAVPGDIDQDGDVDFADVEEFRRCLRAIDRPGCRAADFNGDDQVDIRDVSGLRDAFIDFQSRLVVPGDFDADGDFDLADFLEMARCFTGPNRTVGLGCFPADFDGDRDADLADVVEFQAVYADSASGPPSAPRASTSPTTRDSSVIVAGTAPGAALVRITGGALDSESAVTNGAFLTLVTLRPNRINRLFVIGVNSAGIASAPTSLTVTHDSQPPSLFIDFPVDDAEITTETTDVAGRVSDILNGFMGLTVTVNGMQAVVDVGIGTNGTFTAAGVPLTLDGRTTISATATDDLGNTITKQITVSQVPIPPDVPRMEVVSGNGQTGSIDSLLNDPIVVRVSNADGTPIPDKIVTFDVTRSNGRLTTDGPSEGAMMLQVRTDADGLARAHWRLGSDAGCGNNRVEAKSTSIAGTVALCASALPGPAAQINIGSGNNQRGEVNAPAHERLKAWVNDSCNGVRGVPVTFTVMSGRGKVNGLDRVVVSTGDTGHAEVDFVLGPGPGINIVEADFSGNPGNAAVFNLFGVVRDPTRATRFTGLVVDNASRPIQGAVCRLRVSAGGSIQETQTDRDGQFRFEDITGSGHADLLIDGLTATAIDGQTIPQGSFPFLHFEPIIVPNAENALPAPIRLPPLNPSNARTYDGTQDVELTVQGIDGLKMIVTAGSMTHADGSRPSPASPAILALNPVHHDDVPMPMPDGAAPPFAWTLQPAGATFDPPVRILYPNMSALPAGAVSYFLSFNHDTNRFEIIGSGRVSADGAEIVSDPGVGIAAAGWGCNCPPYSVTGSCSNSSRRPPCPASDPNCHRPPPPPPPPCPDPPCCGPLPAIAAGVAAADGPSPVLRCAVRCFEDHGRCQGYTVAGGTLGLILCAFTGPGFGVCLGGAASLTVLQQVKCARDSRVCQDRCEEDHGPGCPAAVETAPVEPQAPEEQIAAQITADVVEIMNLVRSDALEGRELPPSVADQVTALLDHANDVAGGDALAFLRDQIRTSEERSAALVAEVGEDPGNAPPYPVLYMAEIYQPNGVLRLRGETDALGVYSFAVPSDGTLGYVSFFDPRANAWGAVHPRVTDPQRLPRFYLHPVDESFPDFDSDGLPDVVEFVYGSDPADPDTDGDGVTDGAEVQQGTSPIWPTDETWTVTVNGQTVPVHVDGTFTIANISAGDVFGPGGPGALPDFLSDDFFRVTGTSTKDGVTRYVFSDRFQIRDRQVLVVDGLTITDAPPEAPVAMGVSADVTTLTAIGQTAQLQTLATLGDGSIQDVTKRTSWTIYRTSNPNIATVGPDGMVTAVARGPVVMTATNEGATAVMRMLVSLEPFTTVEGRVRLAEGTPVAGAVVTIVGLGGMTITGADGRFAIPNIPADLGQSLTLVAEGMVDDAQVTGRVTGVKPVPGGITDAGIITLAARCDLEWAAGLFPNANGTNSATRAMVVFDDGTGPALYAGGAFTSAGGVAGTSRIARWNGAAWSALGSGLNNIVTSLTVFDDGSGPVLFAGGIFTTAGGESADRIARWDGTAWSALESGMNGGPSPTVFALAVFDDGSGPVLCAGGSFNTAGGVNAANIAQWNGTEWSPLGTGVNSIVNALTVFDDGTGPALYAAGRFTAAGAIGATLIARWDGTEWSPVGTGLAGTAVNALIVFDDGTGPALYAGGEFGTTGGVTANRIARWDGTAWSPLGSGLVGGNQVNALTVFDDGTGPALYVGGLFSEAGGVSARSVARWDGAAWSPLGSGVNNIARSLGVFDDGSNPALYVGGDFLTAGGTSSVRIAKWHRPEPPCP